MPLALTVFGLLVAGCASEGGPRQPVAGAYRAGVAQARLPIPVGIGTSGFGFSTADSKTPFAVIYPGTTSLHTHPDVRVVVVEAVGADGAARGRLILVRIDTIGVSAAIREGVADRLRERFGERVDHELVIAATHTHAGPGRLIDRSNWELIQDAFFPELFEAMVDTVASTAMAAADDLEDAHIGHAVAKTARLNDDRRCSNPEADFHDATLVRVDRSEGGGAKALLVFHPVHPVAVGAGSLALSKDVSGGIEEKLEEAFDAPLTVIHFNGAAADLTHAPPSVDESAAAAPWPHDFEKVEALGEAAAQDLMPAARALETVGEGIVTATTAWAPLNVEALGYAPGGFPEHGAVYCGASLPEACIGEPKPEGMLDGCVVFPDEASAPPDRAPFTVARLGGLVLATTPGEFSVELGRRVMQAAIDATGSSDVALVGYAQEYTGYSLAEDDWWHGGYEASGALWGPRQGDYLTSQAVDFVSRWSKDPLGAALPGDPGAPAPPAPYAYEPFRATDADGMGSLVEPSPEVAAGEVVEWVFGGPDPWEGAPLVTIEQDIDGAFTTVPRPSGAPWTSDGYAITLHLSPDPPYTQRVAPSRTFRWTARMPVGRRYGGGPPMTEGETYRLVSDSGAVSEPFRVTP